MAGEKPQRTERLHLLVTKEELALIEDFRLHVRLPTTAAVVRELLKRGLASKEETYPLVICT
jgi:hypothetical protein